MKHEKAKQGFGGRLQPKFDRLESRLALSGTTLSNGLSNSVTSLVAPATLGSSLTIVSVSPSPSSILTTSPTSILVSFDRPIDPTSLGSGNIDFQLFHVASDGSLTPLGVLEAGFDEALDPSDPTGSRVSLTLSTPLVAGNYRLLLSPGSFLHGIDGAFPVGNNGLATDLSDFSISPPKDATADAQDLGTVGPTPVVLSDGLNLAADSGAVKYYKLTLAPGHQWRLGLEITAMSEGSQLTSALSLFDSRGHLISTDNIGLSNQPSDPYLFAGLAPGSYYVGVSDSNNLPDSSGVYHPSQLGVDKSLISDPGGAFHLHVVADPADQPTRVLGLRLDHADPLSSDPSGLTLQFSGSIQLASLLNTSQPSVTLVDRNGQAWPLTPNQYDGSLGQLTFLFDQPLPAGTYTLEIGNNRGLVNLAGEPPVGLGLDPKVLGTFRVASQSKPTGDLGPLLPSLAENGLTSSFTIESNSSTTKQFVVVGPGYYVISGVSPLSGVNYTLLDSIGNVIALGPGQSALNNGDVLLNPGIYSLTLANSGANRVDVSVTIREKQVSFSQLLENGVAQGAAFSLRLVSPQVNFGAGSTGVGPSINTTANVVDPQTGAGSGSASTAQGRVVASDGSPGIGLLGPNVFSTAGILSGISPVGYPSSQTNQISVVGPSGPSGSVALASNVPGIPSGLLLVPSSNSPGEGSQSEIVPTEPVEIKVGDAPSLKRSSTIDAGTLAQSAESRRVDEQTLAGADWIGRLVSKVIGLVERSDVSDVVKNTSATKAIAVVSEDGIEVGTDEAQVESASLTSPFAIGVGLATIGYRFRRNLTLRSFSRSNAGPNPMLKDRDILTGPHRRTRIRVNLRNS